MDAVMEFAPMLVFAFLAFVGFFLYGQERRGKEREVRLAVADATEKLKNDLDVARQECQDLKDEKNRLRNDFQKEIDALKYTVKDKNEEIERIKNDRAKLSVKLLGESLEQHCETAFNRVRAYAFPNAEFKKDNDARQHSKGDYIYRECDEEGVELLSIMFEMKNEAESSVNTKKNTDHLKKLNNDRINKNCEYAVLVSLLEPDSDLYNTGIVDVSHIYPKTFVIRPQFFIPFIGLLRNASLSALSARQELERKLREDVDLRNFENKLENLKGDASKHYDTTHTKCESAHKNIDAAVQKIQALQHDLEQIDKSADRAKKHTEKLTIRRLTHGNKAMKDRIEAANKFETEENETVQCDFVVTETDEE